MSNKNGRSKTLKYCQKIEFKTNVSKAHTVLFLQYMVTHAFWTGTPNLTRSSTGKISKTESSNACKS